VNQNKASRDAFVIAFDKVLLFSTKLFLLPTFNLDLIKYFFNTAK